MTEHSHPLFRSLATFAAAVTLLASAGAAHAKLTGGQCLAQKRAAWITLRKCQGTEQVRQLKGKPADPTRCQTKYQDAFAKITAKATKAAIACRYGDNGDGTVTDYDTGLQWEQKSFGTCSNALLLCSSNDDCPSGTCVSCPRCVDAVLAWADAEAFVSGTSDDGFTSSGALVGLSGHSDWRLPTVSELETIIDVTQGLCGGSSGACIDPIFGPTDATFSGSEYWSATTYDQDPAIAWAVFFGVASGSDVLKDLKTHFGHVRAVRTDL